MVIHSDDDMGIQRLNQEAAKAMAKAAAAKMPVAPERAIRWLTANAARALGVADQVGTLAPGMRADVVVWNRDPFSVYARADQVFIDGALVHDRNSPRSTPRSDFMLGQPGAEGAR